MIRNLVGGNTKQMYLIYHHFISHFGFFLDFFPFKTMKEIQRKINVRILRL